MEDPASVAARLDGRHVLVTGVTGFVGEALLHLLLTEVPGVRLSVLVRPKGSTSGRARIAALLGKPIFAPAVEAAGGVESLLDARLDVVEGDLDAPPSLPPGLDAVVHCAGDVSFDPPVDEGFRTNVVGTRELLARVREAGPEVHYVHISTAYVAGRRSGSILEGPVDHDVDLDAETIWGLGQRAAVEARSRTTEVLVPQRKKAERAHSRAGLLTAATATEAERRSWVKRELVPDRHRAGPQPRLDRLLHLHQGARRAGGRGARPRAPGLDRPAEHHRVRPGAALPGVDRGLQDGRAADPGLRPR